MNPETINEYSLWIEPSPSDMGRIQNVIVNFSKEAEVESFIPHVTLIGNIPYDPLCIHEQLIELSEIFFPFTIAFKALLTGPDYFKCLFLECQDEQRLIELNRKAREIFNKKASYKPHMSLVYGNIDEILKKKFTEDINKYGLEYFSFTPEKISLFHAQGSPKNWRRLHEVTLAQK